MLTLAVRTQNRHCLKALRKHTVRDTNVSCLVPSVPSLFLRAIHLQGEEVWFTPVAYATDLTPTHVPTTPATHTSLLWLCSSMRGSSYLWHHRKVHPQVPTFQFKRESLFPFEHFLLFKKLQQNNRKTC